MEPGKTVKEIVQEGVQEIVDTLKEYEEVNERFGDPEVLEDPDKMDALINRQAELQDKIDATDAWTSTAVWNVPWSFALSAGRLRWWMTLSGSERRRVALGRLPCLQHAGRIAAWMSRPTTWTPSRSTGWSNICNNMPVPLSASRTTVTS